MADAPEKDLRESLRRIESELIRVKEALGLLGLRPCSRCRRFFRRADAGTLFDCGELVCYGCVPEWWPLRCSELSVEGREGIERKLVHWLATHHHCEIIRDPKKLPQDHPEDLQIIATCEECRGIGVQEGRRCPFCAGTGTIRVLLKKGLQGYAGL